MKVRVSEQVARLLDEARGIARNSSAASNTLVVPLVGPHHVAFLTTVDGREPRCVILLKHGTNEIGRSCSEYSPWKSKLAGVIEGWQWRIECSPVVARVQDDRSTDGSAVLPTGSEPLSLEQARSADGASRLGWDGIQANALFVALSEGDILVNQYRAFAFGWIRTDGP